jgi:hypothetical protein
MLLELSSYCGNYGKALAGSPIGQFHLGALGQCDQHRWLAGHTLALHKSDWPEGTSSAVVANVGHILWWLLMADGLATACAPGNQC